MARDAQGKRIVDRSWVTSRENIQGNCEAISQAIEAGVPEEVSFVLVMFPRGESRGAALAGRGKAAEIARALHAALESANRAKNQGSRLVLPG